MEILNTNSDAGKHPLVTVITVVYNNAIGLKNTIESVRAQTYPHIEYIIIDGGSTDGTVDVIKKYADSVRYWVSEKDAGIYDAMNKGVAQAKGEWVQFLHAGDTYVSQKTLETIFLNQSLFNVDIVYGNTVEFISGATRKRIEAAENLSELWRKSVFGHECSFTRRLLLDKFPFDTSYKIVGDYNFIFKCYSAGYVFKQVPIDVAVVQPPGFSRQHWLRSTIEAWRVARTYKKKFSVDVFYFKNIVFNCLVHSLKYFLPYRAYEWMKKLYNNAKII